MSDKNELEKIYGKAYINEDLLDMVIKARHSEDNEVLHDDSFKDLLDADWDELDVNEKRYLSEFGRQIERYSKDEMAVIVYEAITLYPEMVFQLMMEEYIKNKECKNESSKNV